MTAESLSPSPEQQAIADLSDSISNTFDTLRASTGILPDGNTLRILGTSITSISELTTPSGARYYQRAILTDSNTRMIWFWGEGDTSITFTHQQEGREPTEQQITTGLGISIVTEDVTKLIAIMTTPLRFLSKAARALRKGP